MNTSFGFFKNKTHHLFILIAINSFKEENCSVKMLCEKTS